MQQLINPNPNVPCKPGWCLEYVQDTYGIGPKYPTATAAWNASQHKHQDQNWPALWFPVWFTVQGVPAGHVALHAPDHSIYSSSHPTSTTPTHHASLAALQSYYGGRLGYLGWTEDVEDTLVIGGNDMAIIQNADNWRGRAGKSFQMIRGRGMSEAEFQNFVGKDFLALIEALEDNPEADANVDFANWGRTAKNDHWDTQIATLQQQLSDEQAKDTTDAQKVADLTTQLTNLQSQKASAAVAAPVVPSDTTMATAKLNALQVATKVIIDFIKSVGGF